MLYCENAEKQNNKIKVLIFFLLKVWQSLFFFSVFMFYILFRLLQLLLWVYYEYILSNIYNSKFSLLDEKKILNS